jgi:hypothetical protein
MDIELVDGNHIAKPFGHMIIGYACHKKLLLWGELSALCPAELFGRQGGRSKDPITRWAYADTAWEKGNKSKKWEKIRTTDTSKGMDGWKRTAAGHTISAYLPSSRPSFQ